MTRKTRRLIFLIFILIFIIVTPGVLLFATGYSFNWNKGEIIKTGSFYFNSLPQGASITINGETKNSTPAYIPRLTPGQFVIEITKENFLSWKKNLTIEAQLTTEARNILLPLSAPKPIFVTATSTPISQYFLSVEQKADQKKADMTATSTLTDILTWTVFQKNIYYIQNSDRNLYKAGLDGSSPEQISTASLPQPKTNYQIVVSSEQTGVFEPGGNFYLLDNARKTFQLTAQGVRGIEFSTDNEKVLYWTNHELWVIWLKDVLAQPYRKAQEKELINRYSDEIKQAAWLTKTNEHVLYSVVAKTGQAQIKLTELDNRDIRNTYDIFSSQNPEIYFNSQDNLLYVLMEAKLYSLDILGTKL